MPKKRNDRDSIFNEKDSTGYEGPHNNAIYQVHGLCDIDIKVKYQICSLKYGKRVRELPGVPAVGGLNFQ